MIRNLHIHIQHFAIKTKRENSIYLSLHQFTRDMQIRSPFQTSGHSATQFLNKSIIVLYLFFILNCKTKISKICSYSGDQIARRSQTSKHVTSLNHNRNTAIERSVIYNYGLNLALLAPNPRRRLLHWLHPRVLSLL